MRDTRRRGCRAQEGALRCFRHGCVAECRKRIPAGYCPGRNRPDPNFVELTGPKTILDGIKEIKTDYKVFNKLDQNLTFDLPLVLPDNIQSSIKKTEVKIFIERITEGELKLPIEIRNNSDSLKLVMVPNSVSIKYVAPVSKFNQVSNLDFLAFVDFTDVNEENKRVKIEIESINPLAKMISFEPSFAEFIILEK